MAVPSATVLTTRKEALFACALAAAAPWEVRHLVRLASFRAKLLEEAVVAGSAETGRRPHADAADELN
eukprot:2007422-Lingulodinium_polyedra.AAC.1